MCRKIFGSQIQCVFMAFILTALAAGCKGAVRENDIAGKTYVYEKEGFGGDFVIQINKDGTFSCYEGPLSSYYGIGEWTLDGDTLCLSEDAEAGNGAVYYFKADGKALTFLEEKSDRFLFIQAVDGDKFIERREEENTGETKRKEETIEEGSGIMTVREYARLLEEAGIKELTEEKIAQVEAMIENLPEEAAEALEPEQVPAFLLTAVGRGEYDPDSLSWTPDSSQVYSFDLEVFDSGKMYTHFLEGIRKISEGEFEITQIDEVSGEEGPEGPESHRIQFCYNGTEYAYDAEVYYDWFDTGMIAYMNQVFEKEKNPKRLYAMGDGYQECIVLYCTEEWADEFNRKTGCGVE